MIKKILGGVGAAVLAAGGLVCAGLAYGETAALVSMRIEGAENTYWNGEVTANGCTLKDENGGEHTLGATAACVLEAAAESAGFQTGWQDFGFGVLINTVGTDTTPADWSKSWSFWINGEPASVGMDAYEVKPGDEIWLMYSGWPTVPLRVTGPEEVAKGSEGSFRVEKLTGDYDADFQWQGGWLAASEATILIDGEARELSEEGGVIWQFDQLGTVGIQAIGEGFVRSETKKVRVGEEPANETPDETENGEEGNDNDTPEEGEEDLDTSEEMRKAAARKALDYMKSQQEADGSIGGDLVSGWAAIAWAADGQAAGAVSNGGISLLSYLANVETDSVTDLEKQILAVRAAGYDARQWAGRDLVKELEEAILAGATKETELANDEIFGLLAMTAAGLPSDAEIIKRLNKEVQASQDDDGSWGGIDLTAAAIQALAAGQEDGEWGEGEIIKGVEYLRGHQDAKGGFGNNSATTAWSIQALLAAGENPDVWMKGGRNPWQALLTYQADNGGFGWQSREDVSLLMTAYAVPALLGKPWPIIGQAGEYDEALIIARETVPAGKALAGSVLGTASSPAVTLMPAEDNEVKTVTISETGSVGMRREADIQEEPDATAEENRETGEEERVKNSVGDHPERGVDYFFLWSIFGMANIGLGSTLTRLMFNL